MIVAFPDTTHLIFVFVFVSSLAALLSPAGKGLAYWLFVCNVFVLKFCLFPI